MAKSLLIGERQYVSNYNYPVRIHALVLLIVWSISVGYLATQLKRGWVPHDEGTLGLSAERVLRGELPHRDFDDYTGGLTFVHALAFRELGINLASMRVVLFIFFATWVPAVYYVASRFGPPYCAGAVTVVAAAWSVPNYPGPMPSWYNLFFATFGVAALLRYLEVHSRRWVILAGICAGFSVLAKITAAYFVAGVFLFFVFREQTITSEENHSLLTRGRVYSVILTIILGIFVALLVSMVHRTLGVRQIIYFVLPACFLVSLIIAREFVGTAGSVRKRFMRLLNMCVPFGLGIAVPVIGFLVPFVRSGAVHDLMLGLIATPNRAIRFAALVPERPVLTLTIIPFIVVVLVANECRPLGRAICGSILALMACVVLIFSKWNHLAYDVGWYSLAAAMPALVLTGVAILWVSRSDGKLNSFRQQQIMLTMSVAALSSLIRFPFSAGVYFLYVAPLVILFAAALLAFANHAPRFTLGILGAFYFLFAVLRVAPGFIYAMGHQYAPDTQSQQLTIVRAGGLHVEPTVAQLYDQLIPLVQSRAEGRFIYAAPDCPEVYFLSGLQSPTRHYFDFAEEPVHHTQQTLQLLESLHVNVVAINKKPQFSYGMSPDLEGALGRLYPYSVQVGYFEVRWRAKGLRRQ